MVVNLNTLKRGNKPRFVSKAKRKAIGSTLSRAIKESHQAETPASPIKKEVDIPAWRYEREQSTSDNQGLEEDLGKSWSQKTKSEMTRRDWRIMRHDLGIVELGSDHLPLLSWDDINIGLLPPTWKEPTPIQRAAIPVALTGHDLIGIAQTGSGKTGSFAVPIMLKQLPTLALAPTRELADQIAGELRSLRLEVVTLVGGHAIDDQLEQLEKHWQVIVATPGRLIDCIEKAGLSLNDMGIVVLDEADKMVDMGFESQINMIWEHLAKPQVLMYTATWPPHIQQLAERLAPKAEKVVIRRELLSIRQVIEQPVAKISRLRELLRFTDGRTIVFANRQSEVDAITSELSGAAGMHGGKSQTDREYVLQGLRDGSIHCLVATDVAGRGIDVPDVKLVVNFDMPQTIDAYVHRIGRTGRAGKSGKAVSFVSEADAYLFPELVRVLRESGNNVPSFLLPNHDAIRE